MNLFFIRHGESIANTEKIFSNKGFRYGLTERGITQVHNQGKNIQDIHFDCLITSPLLRAVESAEILSSYINLPISISEALIEFDTGILEDQSGDEYSAIYNSLINDWFTNRNFSKSIEGGESLIDIQNRFIPYIKKLHSECDPYSNIILVGHGGTYSSVLPFLLCNIDLDFSQNNPIDNAACIEVEIRNNNFYCIRWGHVVFKN